MKTGAKKVHGGARILLIRALHLTHLPSETSAICNGFAHQELPDLHPSVSEDPESSMQKATLARRVVNFSVATSFLNVGFYGNDVDHLRDGNKGWKRNNSI